MHTGLRQPWVRGVTSVHCSTEQKATDGAEMLAGHLGLTYTRHEGLGENDRSATGFLPPVEFEGVANAFFGRPEESVRGWERAVDAQSRIVAAVQAIDSDEPRGGTVAIVSHGAVGTLLQCWLADRPIDRLWDQPANGGGNWFAFTLDPRVLLSRWQVIDEAQGS